MSQIRCISPSLQSIKSLPVDFRLVGSPNSQHLLEKFSGGIMSESNVAIGGIMSDVMEEGVTGNVDVKNDESPYSSLSLSAEERPSAIDDDLNSKSFLLQSTAPRVESKWSDTKSYSAKKKLQSWFQLPDGNWELGTILSTSVAEVVVSFSEGKVLKMKSDDLLPSNPDILDGVDDLMQLSYLSEPSVLYNLQCRYNRDMIYTKAGPVLVAINPFKKVPLYGNDFIEAYRGKTIDSPHVYAIADTAMREMIRDEVNQSIIIRVFQYNPDKHIYQSTCTVFLILFMSSHQWGKWSW